MLRICNSETGGYQRWILCGQLAGAWVGALELEWRRQRSESSHLRAVVDLSDVTFIDEAGEGLLRELSNQGAEFVAKGIDTCHILDNLAVRDRPQLRRYLGPPGDEGCR
jgi:hypothetical protein